MSIFNWTFALILIVFCLFANMGSCAEDQNIQIRDIGIPVKSVNWVRLHAGHDKQDEPCLYATMGQNAQGLFVLQVDPKTGESRQFITDLKNANFPTATLMSRSGILYIGSAYAGHLLCFDPEQDRLEDLGAINPDGVSFPCRMDEDQEGKIWIGSYGTADLTCYDPQKRKFTRYGRMDDVDMYNYPLVNTDGTIACLIRMTKPHVVVFNPETGEKKTVGPITTKGEETIDLRKGNDNRLYIDSSLGKYRIEGMKAVPVDQVPDSALAPTLPDGSTFSFADASDQMYRQLKIDHPDGKSQVFELDYEASGSDIFYIHAGPDGCVYGSSYLPLHLFRYDPAKDELVDLGKCSAASGEAYSMANFEGKIYISSYPGARVSVYDPSKPYHYGTDLDDNPRDLGRIDDISYRPRSTLAGPLNRVWLASIPDYGRWGGPLSYYEPATETKKAYYRIVGDGSCYTLAYLAKQKLLAVGTSISGGSGTKSKVDQAVLFLFDYEKEQKVWEGTLERPVTVFNSLLAGPAGELYGTVRGGNLPPELFIFDPQTRTFADRIPITHGNPLDLGLCLGPDRNIYGFTNSGVYRFNKESKRIEEIIQTPISVPGPIVGENIYFSHGHVLQSAGLFKRE